jgi:acetylornithine deacetylase/succinyl-diaminopimelate desuccinylase-like protein
LDVRPATEKLNANKLVLLMENCLKQQGLKLLKAKIRHDLYPWLTSKSLLRDVEEAIAKTIPIKYVSLGKIGYIDTQLLWNAFEETPCFTFGAGEGRLAHKPNEYAVVTSLNKCQEIISGMIYEFCNGR